MTNIKNTPEISVLLSTYNNQSSIENSIKSILSQSYNDFELLIINDASNDRTLKKIKQFENVRSQVKVEMGAMWREMIGTVICDGWGIYNYKSVTYSKLTQ